MTETVNKSTGEIFNKDTAAIRPVIDTLRQFPEEMDAAAKQLHSALDAVRAHGKPATVTITMKIEPMKVGLVEAPLTISVDSDSKLPKNEPEKKLFYQDDQGNATRQPPQRELDIGVKLAADSGTGGVAAAA
jgi:uncharacterized protein YjbK